MANSKGNPIIIDTVGEIWATTEQVRIRGIQVIASAGNWEFELKTASAGTTVARAKDNVTGNLGGYIPISIGSKGLYAATLTNITQLLVYTDGV